VVDLFTVKVTKPAAVVQLPHCLVYCVEAPAIFLSWLIVVYFSFLIFAIYFILSDLPSILLRFDWTVHSFSRFHSLNLRGGKQRQDKNPVLSPTLTSKAQFTVGRTRSNASAASNAFQTSATAASASAKPAAAVDLNSSNESDSVMSDSQSSHYSRGKSGP
jgi:hypothetical protein